MGSEENFQKQLGNTFPKAGKEKWIAAVSKESNKDWSSLDWTFEGMRFQGYYSHEEFQQLIHKVFNAPSPLPVHNWYSLCPIAIEDGQQTIHQASENIQYGADGNLFLVTRDVDISPWIDDERIQSRHAVFLVERNKQLVIPKIVSHDLLEKKDPRVVFLFTYPGDAHNFCRTWLTADAPGRIGLHLGDGLPVLEQISECLYQGVELIERLLSLGVDLPKAIGAVAFSLPASDLFLIQVAKIKALRRLWFQVANTYNLNDYKLESLYIHTIIYYKENATYDPHHEMIENPFSIIASVAGTANGVTVYGDVGNSLSRRMARNTSIILKKESFLNHVSDPLAGAYAIEAMIDQLSEKAWHHFQNRMQSV